MTAPATPLPTLTKTRIQAGIWEGILTGAGDTAPELFVTHLEKPVAEVSVSAVAGTPGQWLVRVPVPAQILSDGVQTFLISDRATGQRLTSFAIIAGEPLEDDIRAEIDLLRAELDMLKQAFRRHCVETGAR